MPRIPPYITTSLHQVKNNIRVWSHKVSHCISEPSLLRAACPLVSFMLISSSWGDPRVSHATAHDSFTILITPCLDAIIFVNFSIRSGYKSDSQCLIADRYFIISDNINWIQRPELYSRWLNVNYLLWLFFPQIVNVILPVIWWKASA